MISTKITSRPKLARNKYGYVPYSSSSSSSSNTSISANDNSQGASSASSFSAIVWGNNLVSGTTLASTLEIDEGGILSYLFNDMATEDEERYMLASLPKIDSGVYSGYEFKVGKEKNSAECYPFDLWINNQDEATLYINYLFKTPTMLTDEIGGLTYDEATGGCRVHILDDILVDGNATFNSVAYFNSTINSQSIVPQVTKSYSLGLPNFYYSDGYISNLHTDNIENADTITTKNLDVTGSAHFHELVIDKIKATGGSIIITPADGFTTEAVTIGDDGYYLYWRASDDTGTKSVNMWEENDQAICKNFNQAKAGTSQEVDNVYYWTLVTEVSSEPRLGKDYDSPDLGSLEDDIYYHYIYISNTDYDGVLNPQVGQEIVMLGHRGPSDETDSRQSAIMIASYGTDKFTESTGTGLTAPFYAQYRGINDYSLISHRKSYFDAKQAKFVGDFTITTATEEQIKEIAKEAKSGNPYIGTNKHWWIYNDEGTAVDTGILAEGVNGTNGTNGTNGVAYSLVVQSSEIDDDTVDYWTYTELYAYKNDGGTTITLDDTTNFMVQIWDTTSSPNEWIDATCVSSGLWIAEESGVYTTRPKSIKLRLYDTVNDKAVCETTYNYEAEKGAKGDKGDTGESAINIALYPINETALVTAEGRLDTTFMYYLYKEEGDVRTALDDSTYLVKCRATGKETSYTQIPYDEDIKCFKLITTNWGNYYDEETGSTYYSTSNAPKEFEVQVYNKTTLEMVFLTSVKVTNTPTALFTVKTGLTQSIQANTESISRVEQTAEDIKIAVNETGIDIENHKITLNADNTIVEGNLFVTDKDGAEGIVLQNEDGTPSVVLTNDNVDSATTGYYFSKYFNPHKTLSYETDTITLTPSLKEGDEFAIKNTYMKIEEFYTDTSGARKKRTPEGTWTYKVVASTGETITTQGGSVTINIPSGSSLIGEALTVKITATCDEIGTWYETDTDFRVSGGVKVTHTYNQQIRVGKNGIGAYLEDNVGEVTTTGSKFIYDNQGAIIDSSGIKTQHKYTNSAGAESVYYTGTNSRRVDVITQSSWSLNSVLSSVNNLDMVVFSNNTAGDLYFTINAVPAVGYTLRIASLYKNLTISLISGHKVFLQNGDTFTGDWPAERYMIELTYIGNINGEYCWTLGKLYS